MVHFGNGKSSSIVTTDTFTPISIRNWFFVIMADYTGLGAVAVVTHVQDNNFCKDLEGYQEVPPYSRKYGIELAWN